MTIRTCTLRSHVTGWCRAVACACSLLLLPPFASPVEAQLIPVKTAPVAEADQFGFLPLVNLAMGGVSIALADTLYDPFNNPATAARLRRGEVFGSPRLYSLSRNAGDGRTMPVSAFLKFGSTFGGIGGALQEVNPAKPEPTPIFAVADVAALGNVSLLTPHGSAHTNQHVLGMLGHSFAAARLSLASNIVWSKLRAVDGTEGLYPGNQGVDLHGDVVNLRFGMLKEWDGARSLEAVLVHNRYGMTHDVTFQDNFWDPTTRQNKFSTRLDHNAERTHTSGIHVAYTQPFADSGWRVGALLTANRTTQPTAPVLGMMTIGRTPGQSSAYDVGVGVARSHAASAFGIDAIYEPIWSHQLQADQGADESYRFSNVILRTGVSQEFPLAVADSWLRLQAGIQLRSIQYHLDQSDGGEPPQRFRESWMEWTHSAGATFRTNDLELRYVWRLQSGTGRPGMQNNFGGGFCIDFCTLPGLPPRGEVILVPVRITTQQFSISVPMP